MQRVVFLSLLSIAAATIAFPQGSGGAILGSSSASRARIQKLEELTWRQIDALDRDRTLFILPIGMIEEHGPHLPVGSDTLGVTYEATRVSHRVSGALPDWKVVMMPPINYGQGGANEIGGIVVHPGTYAIRQSTLRSTVADIGGQVAQNGFKWLFVLNGHAGPPHNIAINEACDFVSETFRVTMLHVTALFRADPAIQSKGKKINEKYYSPAELASLGMDVHAGVGETSAILAIRPDLVAAGYKTLPSLVGHHLGELVQIASQPGWQGYLSAPSKAKASYGQAFEAWWVEGFSDLILRAIRGENMFEHPRLPAADFANTPVGQVLRTALENERAFEQKLANWLAQRKSK